MKPNKNCLKPNSTLHQTTVGRYIGIYKYNIDFSWRIFCENVSILQIILENNKNSAIIMSIFYNNNSIEIWVTCYCNGF